MKKLFAVFAAVLFAANLAFAQDDDFFVDLDENLSDGSSAPAEGGGGGGNSSIDMGLWIELYGRGNFLVRDAATNEKTGYEFDEALIYSEANWWFWGDFGKRFHLDAEIAVWNFERQLYKANTFADNTPDVTWGDGLQNLLTMPFSFIKNWNDNEVGFFKKFGLNLDTPLFDIRLGYGDLKKNGMSQFVGIYNVLDRQDYVGDGYTELKNGSWWQSFGDLKIDFLAALSMTRGKFGTYDYIDFQYGDLFEVAATFGSYSDAKSLFYYFDNYKSAFGLYGKVNIIEGLSLELHGFESFSNAIDIGSDTGAAAARVGYESQAFDISLMHGIAGKNANSAWGSDGQEYDLINAGKMTTLLRLNVPASFAKVGLDEMILWGGVGDSLGDKWTFRTQPMLDFDLSEFVGRGTSLGAYAVLNVDRMSDFYNNDAVFYMHEAGLEFCIEDLGAYLKRLQFDYTANFEYAESQYAAGDKKYSLDHMINYFGIIADLTDSINVHLGSFVRTNQANDKSYAPFGIAAGASFKNLPCGGSPMLYVHFAYGMNPYEDNNYSMYTKTEKIGADKILHRTYLPSNTYDGYNKSMITIGMIFDL